MDSRSSCNEPAEKDATSRNGKYEPSSVLFSSAALQTPFALSFLRPSRASHSAAVDVPHIFKELQKSVASTADRCAEMLQSLVDANPVLKMFAPMSCQFRDFCGQVRTHSKHSQNVSFHTSNFAAILPGDSVAGMVVSNGILNFLNIYNTILVVRLVLTWFPNAPPAIVSPLSTLCDPYLNIFRGLIPPLGGTLDLSPILAFLVLNAFTSTASALPAELPPSMRSQEGPVVHETHSNYTTSQKKWMRRFRGKGSKHPGGLISVVSPLIINRRQVILLEEDEPVNLASWLHVMLLILLIPITMSRCLEGGFTRFDPDWIHRVGGSSVGIVATLIIFDAVLKFKTSMRNWEA